MSGRDRVLVTGGGGFIGRSVAQCLTRDGRMVRPWAGPLDAIRQWDETVDAVVHLAGAPRQFAADADATSAEDLRGTEAVLEYCRTSGARCVFASTAGVYWHGGARPLGEDAPLGPVGSYASGKLAAEERCHDAADRFRVPCTVLRLFNVYGPGQRPPFLVPHVIASLLATRPLELRMPDAVRDFVFVEDVARAFCAAVDFVSSGFRVFNIGTGQGTRVTDLVASLARVLGKSHQWSCPSEPVAEAAFSVADISRARAEMRWQPLVDLEVGLAATCAVSLLATVPGQ